MIDARFRPLPVWPYPVTEKRRSKNTFKAGWADTLALLERELTWLGGSGLVIGAGFSESDLRVNGWPRANAREPVHPGVELTFDSDRGRLTYRTDACESWQANVRSIALGLEALRAVDRYGITSAAQQYAGFRAIESGIAAAPQLARGRRLIAEHGSEREALRRTHPDVGGNRADFEAVMAARGAA